MAVEIPYPFVGGSGNPYSLHPRVRYELWRNFEELRRSKAGGAVPTILVAASNSLPRIKAAADFVCNGINDQVVLSDAIAALPTRGGRIVLAEGTFVLTGTVSATFTTDKSVLFYGMGIGGGSSDQLATRIERTSSGALFSFTATGAGTAAVVGFFGVELRGVTSLISTAGAKLHIEDCRLEATDATGAMLSITASNNHQGSVIRNNQFFGAGSSSAVRAISIVQAQNELIVGNQFVVTFSDSASRVVSVLPNAGFSGECIIANNRISASSGDGVHYAFGDVASAVSRGLILGNKIRGAAVGIRLMGARDTAVLSNHIIECGMGVQVGGSGTAGIEDRRILIANNFVTGTTGGTAHIRVSNNSAGAVNDVAIMFNKLRGTTPANAVVIASGVTSAAVAYNDTFSGFGTAALSDSGTGTRTEASFITSGTLDILARVAVRINSAGSVFSRRRLNFITADSAALAISHADDPANEEVDITFTPSPRTNVRKNSGGSTFTRGRLNFIEGSGISITVADDSADDEVDVTIINTGGGGGGGGGSLVVQVDNTTVGTEPQLDLRAGAGIVLSGINDPGVENVVEIAFADTNLLAAGRILANWLFV